MSQNLHAIKVRYLPPTEHLPARVKLESLRFDHNHVTLSFDDDENNIQRQAAKYLECYGFNIVATAEAPDFYLILTDRFQRI